MLAAAMFQGFCCSNVAMFDSGFILVAGKSLAAATFRAMQLLFENYL